MTEVGVTGGHADAPDLDDERDDEREDDEREDDVREDDPTGSGERAAPDVELNLAGQLVVVLAVGAALFVTARSGALPLLICVAAVQVLTILAWVFGTTMPGRRGALVVAGAAAVGADVTVSVWPGSRLGTMAIVLALAVPALFAQQLTRGAVRTRVVESLGGTAIVVVAVTALPSLLQLRHEFGSRTGGFVAGGVVLCVAGALVLGCVVDLAGAVPRFDQRVPRGLLAVLVSAVVGAVLGRIAFAAADVAGRFPNGRGVFLGAAAAVVAAFLAVALAFVEASLGTGETDDTDGEDVGADTDGADTDEDDTDEDDTDEDDSDTDDDGSRRRPGVRLTSATGNAARRVRTTLGVLVPLCLSAPVGFLVCLAVRA